jgi:Subtilase family
MATPHVAAIAAVLFSHFPTCTVTEVRYALAYTAKDKGIPGCDVKYGYGIVQLKDAFDYLSSNQCSHTTGWGQKTIRNGTCDLLSEDDTSNKDRGKLNRKSFANMLSEYETEGKTPKTRKRNVYNVRD